MDKSTKQLLPPVTGRPGKVKLGIEVNDEVSELIDAVRAPVPLLSRHLTTVIALRAGLGLLLRDPERLLLEALQYKERT